MKTQPLNTVAVIQDYTDLCYIINKELPVGNDGNIDACPDYGDLSEAETFTAEEAEAWIKNLPPELHKYHRIIFVR